MSIRRNAILREVVDIVRSVLDDQRLELFAATSWDDLPGWDDLHLVSVIIEVECRFDIQFQTAEFARLDSIGDLIGLIETKTAVVSAAARRAA